MKNTEFDVHWLMKLAQEIRENERSSPCEKGSVDQDLAHPALSILGELIDRCGADIETAFLEGYAYGLCQAGLIDNNVLKAVRMHMGVTQNEDVILKH